MASPHPAPLTAPSPPRGAGAAAPADEAARLRLRRNRAVATSLLGLMGGVAIGTHLVKEPGFMTLLVRAGAEAGLVGGIADWFAVTALFRHPLGLPIPHTAIIPSNKERIGQALGRFVERHFLTEEALLARLHRAQAAKRVATWLASPETASMITDSIVRALPYLIRSLENYDFHKFAQRILGEQLRDADVASLLGNTLKVFATSGEADILFERAIAVAARWLNENRTRVDELVRERSRWWIPQTVDRRIATAIVNGVMDQLNGLRQPDSELRLKFRAALLGLIDELLTSEQQREQINRAKNRILQHPDVQAWLASVWQQISEAALEDLARPESKTRAALEKGVVLLGRTLAEDEAMQRHMNAVLERVAVYLVTWKSEIGGFIAEVVRNWDTRTLTERLELVVGSDLQYIRINGTVVGAMAGCLIFLVTWLLT